MQSFYDRQSLEHALTLPRDAQLRRLLRERLDHLATLDPSVGDTAYFVIVEAGTVDDDIEDELGWSPLTDLDGNRFGSDAYEPFHDFIADRDGWFEMIFSASNEAVVIMLVEQCGTIYYGLNERLQVFARQYCVPCRRHPAASQFGLRSAKTSEE